MRATLARLGGAGRYPYPREVWLRSGGYWQEPKHGGRNAIIVVIGIIAVYYGALRYTGERIWYNKAPHMWTPDMLFAKQFRTGELKLRDIEQEPPPGFILPGQRQERVDGPMVDAPSVGGDD